MNRKPLVGVPCASPDGLLREKAIACELAAAAGIAGRAMDVYRQSSGQEHHALALSISLAVGLGWMQVVKMREG
jgi:tryptophanyl-tRNA synthetase